MKNTIKKKCTLGVEDERVRSYACKNPQNGISGREIRDFLSTSHGYLYFLLKVGQAVREFALGWGSSSHGGRCAAPSGVKKGISLSKCTIYTAENEYF